MKIKQLTKEQIIISADRLTRFKNPEVKYLRVFREIILNNLIEPKYKKSDLDDMDYENIKTLAENIINYSLNSATFDCTVNQKLYEYETSVFITGENTKKLLKNNINYSGIISLLSEPLSENLKFLKSLAYPIIDPCVFPVKKVILCEGITEEILLPVFAKVCGYDFQGHGIYIISAGGKNQVVKYFYDYADILKIPIFVLLDNDAVENLAQIKPRLRNIDKIHLVKSGEFEDLLPDGLIIKTLKFLTKNISFAPIEGLENCRSRVEFLEEFFKHRGLHEFKKSDFAFAVKDNISSISDVSVEIKEIIHELNTI